MNETWRKIEKSAYPLKATIGTLVYVSVVDSVDLVRASLGNRAFDSIGDCKSSNDSIWRYRSSISNSVPFSIRNESKNDTVLKRIL